MFLQIFYFMAQGELLVALLVMSMLRGETVEAGPKRNLVFSRSARTGTVTIQTEQSRLASAIATLLLGTETQFEHKIRELSEDTWCLLRSHSGRVVKEILDHIQEDQREKKLCRVFEHCIQHGIDLNACFNEHESLDSARLIDVVIASNFLDLFDLLVTKCPAVKEFIHDLLQGSQQQVLIVNTADEMWRKLEDFGGIKPELIATRRESRDILQSSMREILTLFQDSEAEIDKKITPDYVTSLIPKTAPDVSRFFNFVARYQSDKNLKKQQEDLLCYLLDVGKKTCFWFVKATKKQEAAWRIAIDLALFRVTQKIIEFEKNAPTIISAMQQYVVNTYQMSFNDSQKQIIRLLAHYNSHAMFEAAEQVNNTALMSELMDQGYADTLLMEQTDAHPLINELMSKGDPRDPYQVKKLHWLLERMSKLSVYKNDELAKLAVQFEWPVDIVERALCLTSSTQDLATTSDICECAAKRHNAEVLRLLLARGYYIWACNPLYWIIKSVEPHNIKKALECIELLVDEHVLRTGKVPDLNVEGKVYSIENYAFHTTRNIEFGEQILRITLSLSVEGRRHAFVLWLSSLLSLANEQELEAAFHKNKTLYFNERLCQCKGIFSGVIWHVVSCTSVVAEQLAIRVCCELKRYNLLENFSDDILQLAKRKNYARLIPMLERWMPVPADPAPQLGSSDSSVVSLQKNKRKKNKIKKIVRKAKETVHDVQKIVQEKVDTVVQSASVASRVVHSAAEGVSSADELLNLFKIHPHWGGATQNTIDRREHKRLAYDGEAVMRPSSRRASVVHESPIPEERFAVLQDKFAGMNYRSIGFNVLDDQMNTAILAKGQLTELPRYAGHIQERFSVLQKAQFGDIEGKVIHSDGKFIFSPCGATKLSSEIAEKLDISHNFSLLDSRCALKYGICVRGHEDGKSSKKLYIPCLTVIGEMVELGVRELFIGDNGLIDHCFTRPLHRSASIAKVPAEVLRPFSDFLMQCSKSDHVLQELSAAAGIEQKNMLHKLCKKQAKKIDTYLTTRIP